MSDTKRQGGFVTWLGAKTISIVVYILNLTAFIQRCLTKAVVTGSIFNTATRVASVRQIIFTGLDTLPLLILLALIAGMGFTAPMIVFLSGISSKVEVVDTIFYMVGFELGPLITAIIVIIRSASAMSVDIGNMSLRGEIRGLQFLRISPEDFLVLPRLVATSLSQLALATYFCGIALFSGLVICSLFYSYNFFDYVSIVVKGFEPLLLLLFFIKNILFGFLIAGTACFHSLQVGRSPTEVPQQTQRALVNALTLVFILNVMFVLAYGWSYAG